MYCEPYLDYITGLLWDSADEVFDPRLSRRKLLSEVAGEAVNAVGDLEHLLRKSIVNFISCFKVIQVSNIIRQFLAFLYYQCRLGAYR
jgi:hypothetical protein